MPEPESPTDESAATFAWGRTTSQQRKAIAVPAGAITDALRLGWPSSPHRELFKAIRNTENLPIDHTSITGTVDEELADILIYVCAIANRRNIDLDEALRNKELRNETRVWA